MSFAECHFAVRHHVECRIYFNVTLSVVKLNVVLLSVVMLNVVMLSVAAPCLQVSQPLLSMLERKH